MTPSEYEPGSIIPLSPESGIIAPLPARVYAVAYDKYGVCCVAAVFTTEEKAKAYADAQNERQMQKWGKILDVYYCDDTLDLDPTL